MEGPRAFTPSELQAELDRAQARVRTLESELARHEEEAARRARQLEHYAEDLRETFKEERTRSQQLRRSYRATVRALANAVEARDAYTGGHAERVTAYALELAGAAEIEDARSEQAEFGYLLHDIGKVAVPDAILFKPGPLGNEELALMQRHPVTGWEMVEGVDFLGEARLVIRHHHERWNGGGYPDGLSGEAIPVAARVFAVADALDALTSDRPYRRATGWAAAREVIRAGAGGQFCPQAVQSLDRVSDSRFQELREGAV